VVVVVVVNIVVVVVVVVMVVVVVALVVVVVVVVVFVVVAPCLHWHSFPWRNKGSVPKNSFAHSMLPSTCFGSDQVSPCP